MTTEPADDAGFRVSLSNFDGPFDLLLGLITKRELDITEVSLSAVTDEFIAYLADLGPDENLDEASEFLVVAATLLDMKVAGLLPQGELVDAEAVALLEARDLLFARLLQYRAFKEVAVWFADRIAHEGGRHTRDVPLDEKHRAATPELRWTLSPDDFAALAALALAPREIPTVGLDHLHAPQVSIREQAAIVVSTLRTSGSVTFRELAAGGTTVLLTTQYLEEADRLCSRISVLRGGRVVAEGTPSELKAAVGGSRAEIDVPAGSDLHVVARHLTGATGAPVTIDAEVRRVSLPLPPDADALVPLSGALAHLGLAATDLTIRRPDLDEAFLALTEETTR